MRLTTWNVNGIRNPFSYQPWNTARTFPSMFDILGSDIVVMQELKIQRKDLRDDMVLLDGWDCYFSLPRHKKGYSGVAIYTRNAACAPVKAEEGLVGVLPSPSGPAYCDLPPEASIGGYPTEAQISGIPIDVATLDAEGRCVVLEFPAFVLLGVYSPANSNGLRDDYRYYFLHVLDCRVRNLISAGKRVVLVGDLNVSRNELDSASALDDIKKSGMTHEEYISTPNRRMFNQLLLGGEVVGERDENREKGVLWDTTRAFHPERRGMYTHWEQKINARPGNFGGRIDFVLVADGMQPWIQHADIQEGLLGSDHCPVFVDFEDRVTVERDGEVDLVDIMNPSGHFKQGHRHVQWKATNVPGFSALRLPEFDKRRSIKSMFSAPSVRSQSSQEISHSPADSRGAAAAAEAASPTKSFGPVGPATATTAHAPDDTAKPLHPDNSQATSPEKTSSESFSSSNGGGKRKTPAREDKSVKRQKSSTTSSKTKGQQTLAGFFQKDRGDKDSTPASPMKAAPSVHGSPAAKQGNPPVAEPDIRHQTVNSPALSPDARDRERARRPAATAATASRSPSKSPSPGTVESQLAVVEANQRSWGTLFAKRAAPLCEEHGEPCKSMLTKKKGSNQGRSFWMCARPLGPSGSKERGTQWRCPTFIWCSDWDGKKEK